MTKVKDREARQKKRQRGEHGNKDAKRQRRQSAHGRIRQPDLTRAYNEAVPPFHLTMQDFRVTVIRPDYIGPPLRIDGMVETLQWREERGNPVLLGDVVMRKPDLGGKVNIHDGHQLKLQVRWGGRWKEVWRMRLYDGEETPGGQLSWTLADDGKVLQDSRDDFHYTKSKRKGHPKGWKCHEIVRDIAKRYRIKLGKIAEGTAYMTIDMTNVSPMQVIQRAYAIERRHTTRRFILRWKNGKLNVLPLRRNPIMYVLRTTIEDAIIKKQDRSGKFATAVTMRATVKKKGSNRKREKITVKLTNEKQVAREGFIHRIIKGDDVKDETDARKQAKEYIRDHSVRALTIQGIEHRGIPFLRRGDAIRVPIPGFDFRDRKGQRTKGVCFISSGSWSLASGNFTMSLDVTISDDFKLKKDERKKRDKLTRTQKRNGKVTVGGKKI